MKNPFISQILHYSDLSFEQREEVDNWAHNRVRQVEDRFGVATPEETYTITSGGILHKENSACLLARKGKFGRTGVDFLGDAQAPLEFGVYDTEQEEARMRAVGLLREKLSYQESTFLDTLLSNVGDRFGNLKLTPDHVEDNFETIRDSLHLAMSLFPELAISGNIHQLDMDSALETHIVGVYREVRMGMRKRYPNGFFKSDPKRVGRILTRFMVENLYEQGIGAAKTLTRHTFAENSLGTVFKMAFGCNISDAVTESYPNRFRPWEFDKISSGYWQGAQGRVRAQEATRWLVETRLKLPFKEVAFVSMDDFTRNGLGSMIRKVYGARTQVLALLDAYDHLRPWHFEKNEAPNGYWLGTKGFEKSKEATRWLLEDKLDFDIEDGLRLRRKDFDDNNLGGMLRSVYSTSVSRAVAVAYPDHFSLVGEKRKRLVLRVA